MLLSLKWIPWIPDIIPEMDSLIPDIIPEKEK